MDRTSKESVFLPSVVGGVTLPRMILSPQTNENTPKIKSLSTTSNQIAATGSTTNASCSDTSEVRGVKGEPVKGGADVIVLDDSLEEDFKMPRKRLRTPSAAGVVCVCVCVCTNLENIISISVLRVKPRK